MKSAIFLDRDGVINQNVVRNGRPFAPTKIDDFIILPGVLEAVQAFHKAGYLVIVVTNQPGPPNGGWPMRVYPFRIGLINESSFAVLGRRFVQKRFFVPSWSVDCYAPLMPIEWRRTLRKT